MNIVLLAAQLFLMLPRQQQQQLPRRLRPLPLQPSSPCLRTVLDDKLLLYVDFITLLLFEQDPAVVPARLALLRIDYSELFPDQLIPLHYTSPSFADLHTPLHGGAVFWCDCSFCIGTVKWDLFKFWTDAS